MMIRRLKISDFGAIDRYEARLHPFCNVLNTRYIEEVWTAMAVLLGGKEGICLPDSWVRRGTRITVEILLNGCVYFVEGKPSDHWPAKLELSVVDREQVDVTGAYLYIASHCPEQDAAERFDGLDKSLPFRLCWYRSGGVGDSGNDSEGATAHWTKSKTFRAYLSQYIKAFQPEPINAKKNCHITLDRNGQFRAVHPGASGDACLSETEEKLFLYLCFLNITEFWGNFEKIRDFHYEKKPLLIRYFLEYLDAATDLTGLVARTGRLQRQIIVLTAFRFPHK